MPSSRAGHAGALALACLACAGPQAGTGTAAAPGAAPTHAVAHVPRETRVTEAVSRAPLLSRAAAELLVDDAEARGGAWGDPADASLLQASRGFSRLAPSDLSELGGLLGEAYATLSASDRASVEAYVERVRRGDATSSDERARALLAQAVQALPPPRHARLQALVEAAIREALESERRTALAARETPPPPPPPTRPPAWASRQGDGATYHRPSSASARRDQQAGEEQSPETEPDRLRAAGAAYKQQIDLLEEQIRYAERDVRYAEQAVTRARETPLNRRPLGDPEVTAAEQRLADARADLQRARHALDDLHTKVRRERIPLSYVQ